MLSKESNSPKGQGPYSDLKTAQPYHDTEDHDEEQGFLYTPPKSQNLAARKAIIARGFNASLIVAVICLLSTALLLLYSRMCVLSTSLDEYKAENATRVQAKVAALAKPANISIIGVVFCRSAFVSLSDPPVSNTSSQTDDVNTSISSTATFSRIWHEMVECSTKSSSLSIPRTRKTFTGSTRQSTERQSTDKSRRKAHSTICGRHLTTTMPSISKWTTIW